MLLAIETSSLVSSVALLHDDTLRAELTIQARLTHSEQLMPHIADMLVKASVAKSQIDGVAVSIGSRVLYRPSHRAGDDQRPFLCLECAHRRRDDTD